MGRKIKPIGLHRKPISISLPLDVIGWLDQLVLASQGGVSRSRTIEASLRTSMTKGQTTLTGSTYVWRCKSCTWEATSKKHPSKMKGSGLRYCKSCNENSIYYAGEMKQFEGVEEE